MERCIFCDIRDKKVPADIVYEDEFTVAFLDIAPIAKGHTLVIPKKHEELFSNVDQETARHLAHVLRYVAPKITAALDANGYNLGLNNGKAAGQLVNHVHWHIIPRFSEDGLKTWENHTATPDQLKTIAAKIRKKI